MLDTAFVGDRCYNIFKEFGLLGVSSQSTTDITKGKVNRIGGKFPFVLHQQHIYIQYNVYTS